MLDCVFIKTKKVYNRRSHVHQTSNIFVETDGAKLMVIIIFIHVFLNSL